jgi:hypothetical protein
MLESHIQHSILDYLLYRRIFHYRNNTSGIPIGQTGKFRPSRSRGSADIIGCLKPSGRMFAIEVKQPGKKATPEQQAFLDSINASGGLAFVACSIEDLQAHGI